MTWADEGKNHKSEPKKSGLLPKGREAKEIVAVLAAIYQATHNPKEMPNDDTGVEGPNRQNNNECRKETEE
jgi:hypothetical protein